MNNAILRTAAMIASLMLPALLWQTASAAQTEMSDFMPSYQVSNTTLSLYGVGVFKYMGFISVYSGALYLPPEVGTQNVLEDIPKRLEVKYLRSFKAEDFGPATIWGIKKNVDPQTYRRLESRIAYHNTLYEDVSPGDRVALTYVPSKGTKIQINDKTKGIVKGADFAAALFSLWLGDKPIDSSFKQALLGAR